MDGFWWRTLQTWANPGGWEVHPVQYDTLPPPPPPPEYFGSTVQTQHSNTLVVPIFWYMTIFPYLVLGLLTTASEKSKSANEKNRCKNTLLDTLVSFQSIMLTVMKRSKNWAFVWDFLKRNSTLMLLHREKKQNVSLTKHPATAHFNECNTFTLIKGVDCP